MYEFFKVEEKSESLFNKQSKNKWISISGKKKKNLYLKPQANFYSRWITGPHIKAKTMKLLEENKSLFSTWE